jgi:hypothetical protein
LGYQNFREGYREMEVLVRGDGRKRLERWREGRKSRKETMKL